MRWTARVGRVARIMAAMAVMVVVAAWWPTPQIGAQSASAPFELAGTGAYEAVPQFTALSKPFFDAERALSLSYIGDGDRDGRAALIRGDAAFAISGRPMSDDDTAALKAAGKGVIEAPFALTSIAMVMSAPNAGLVDPLHPPGIRTADLLNPDDPDSPTVFKDVPGPFRLTNDMFGKAFLLNQGPWNTPELNAMIAQQYNGSQLVTYDRPLASVARSDPGAFNYYLEQYLKVGSPTVVGAGDGDRRGAGRHPVGELALLVCANPRRRCRAGRAARRLAGSPFGKRAVGWRHRPGELRDRCGSVPPTGPEGERRSAPGTDAAVRRRDPERCG